MAMSKQMAGQMTIEFVVMFPVAIAIALIAVNAVLFFSECASFDRVFSGAVNTYAASPAYEQGTDQSCGLIRSELEGAFAADNLSVEVSSSGQDGGMVEFRGVLKFQPTLFGSGQLSGAFGVSFPALQHESKLSVSAYKPGVIL